MPKLPPRPCTAPRCRNMATSGSRCDEHQIKKAWVSSEGKTASQRGYGAKWRKARELALRRDNHLCQICLSVGIVTPADQVDHIINKARGGTDALDNLQSICTHCHTGKTIQERR